jgi:hypothetical protein
MEYWGSSLFDQKLAITYLKWPEWNDPGLGTQWLPLTMSPEYPSEWIHKFRLSNFEGCSIMLTLMEYWVSSIFDENLAITYLKWPVRNDPGLPPIKPDPPRLQNTHLNRFTFWNCRILKVTAAGLHWWNIGVHRYLTKSWPLRIWSGRSGMIQGLGPNGSH